MQTEMNGKFDNLRMEMKTMFLEEREEQRKAKTETNRFVIGTIILGASGLIVSIISLFIK